jgi:hypothetical protein
VSLTAYLKKRLIDLLEEKRVVVWYDGDAAFQEVARAFKAPNSSVILAQESRLRARRQADEVVGRLNDVNEASQAKNANLLIYCPWLRGCTDSQRREDPFEALALMGAAFGDKEAETFQSLARQAAPERSREIDRLFAEACPTIALIEGLGKSTRYPLLHQALGTDSLVEIATLVLCRNDAIREVEAVTGASSELLRLLQAGLGFVPPQRVTAMESILEHLGRYVLFSEFALDQRGTLPEQLAGVPRAAEDYRQTVYSLCERMRTSDDNRANFVQKYKEMHRLVRESAGTAVLYIGGENWPTPIPLVNKGKLWYFDTEAGKQEILFRRIGRNEMSAIRVCQELVLAQKEHRSTHNGEYARQIFSDEGQHNGLYWNSTGFEPQSPVGPLVAAATAKGHDIRQAGTAMPFRGYYFELIIRQGKNAPGGAKEYIVNGKMTGGFAFLAYPAEYRSSGVMTFIVDEGGVVMQKDLGSKTDVADKFIKAYNPDSSWQKVEVQETADNEMPE